MIESRSHPKFLFASSNHGLRQQARLRAVSSFHNLDFRGDAAERGTLGPTQPLAAIPRAAHDPAGTSAQSGKATSLAFAEPPPPAEASVEALPTSAPAAPIDAVAEAPAVETPSPDEAAAADAAEAPAEAPVEALPASAPAAPTEAVAEPSAVEMPSPDEAAAADAGKPSVSATEEAAAEPLAASA